MNHNIAAPGPYAQPGVHPTPHANTASYRGPSAADTAAQQQLCATVIQRRARAQQRQRRNRQHSEAAAALVQQRERDAAPKPPRLRTPPPPARVPSRAVRAAVAVAERRHREAAAVDESRIEGLKERLADASFRRRQVRQAAEAEAGRLEAERHEHRQEMKLAMFERDTAQALVAAMTERQLREQEDAADPRRPAARPRRRARPAAPAATPDAPPAPEVRRLIRRKKKKKARPKRRDDDDDACLLRTAMSDARQLAEALLADDLLSDDLLAGPRPPPSPILVNQADLLHDHLLVTEGSTPSTLEAVACWARDFEERARSVRW